MRRNVLPGLRLSLGVTLLYVGLIVVLPLAALVFKAASLGPEDYWRIISSARAVASYRVTALSALGATVFNLFFGLALAWVLTRYRFPGWRLVDAMVDLPFALPTAVAGIALTTLFAGNGWFGSILAQFGIKVAFTPLGIMVAMCFTSLPFIVRTVQPVLEDLDPALEEAAQSLGGSDWQIFRKVILPASDPGAAGRRIAVISPSLGEFGAIIFIAGNQPNSTEITALLVFIRLEEYDYQAGRRDRLGTADHRLRDAGAHQLDAIARLALHGEGLTMSAVSTRRKTARVGDQPLFRRMLIGVVLIFGAFLVLAPLLIIGVEAFSKGWAVYRDTIANPDTRHAIGLTVLTALIAVPVNTAFGVAAAWSITKFDFWGKRFLLPVIEIRSRSRRSSPVSRICSSTAARDIRPDAGAWDVKILFAIPGIVLASMFGRRRSSPAN